MLPPAHPHLSILPSTHCCLTAKSHLCSFFLSLSVGIFSFPRYLGCYWERLALDLPSGRSVRTCTKQQLCCLLASWEGADGSRAPVQLLRVLGAGALQPGWPAGLGVWVVTPLFWRLTVPLQHHLLNLPPLRVTVLRSSCLVSLCYHGVCVLSLG